MSTKTKTAPAATKTTAKPKLDLKQLQQQQMNEETSEPTESGSEDEEYKFHAHEADRIHVKLTKKENDPIKKEYVTVDKVVKLYPVEYDRMKKNGSFDEYDSVTILHDSRKGGSTKTMGVAAAGEKKEPMQPAEGLPTLQDVQMRYQQLYNEVAPADKDYHELLELIKAKDADFGKEKEAE
ncbi:hypothetical protein [Hymenobacter algoricola]|uniref:Uncharacterized protein n=1 Tax=Hymenobacter algoricola TaxID=486267 RepID=A0ABP7N9C1_9BACT